MKGEIRLLFLLAVGCAGIGALALPPTPLFSGLGEPRAAVWSMTPLPGSSSLQVSVDCSGFAAVAGAEGYVLRIPGQASAAKPGAPEVPGLAKLVPGIKGMRAVLMLQGLDPTNVTDVIVAPVEGYQREASLGLMPPARRQRQSDPEIYNKAQFWPSGLGWVDEAWIGTQKVVRLECFPVQYDPVSKKIRFYRRLEGVLRFECIAPKKD